MPTSGSGKGKTNKPPVTKPVNPTNPPQPSSSDAATLLTQPPFDPRIRRLAQPFGTGTTPIQRGYLIWDPNVPWPPPYGNSKASQSGSKGSTKNGKGTTTGTKNPKGGTPKSKNNGGTNANPGARLGAPTTGGGKTKTGGKGGTTTTKKGGKTTTTKPTPTASTAGQTFSNAPKILFLYNPSTVAASYQISDATAQSALLYPVTSVQPVLRVPLQQQLSLTLMFDRTYEMNTATTNPGTSNKDATDPQSQLMAQLGVELDVLAVKQFTGMFASVYSADGTSNNPFTPPSSGDSSSTPSVSQGTNVNSNFTLTGINQGVMQMTMAYLYLGSPTGLRYYGYIDSWDVQYTHFNQLMVPMRAVVDLSFTLLPPPQANTNTSTGAASVAANQLTNPTLGTIQQTLGLPTGGLTTKGTTTPVPPGKSLF